MEIELDINKDIHKNAQHYFELAKKSKKKYVGAEKALQISFKKLDNIKLIEKKQQKRKKSKLKTYWYEKFRWFFSSNDFLVVCGKDATSNEVLIKKHSDKEDLVFHTEMPKSPFCLIKADKKEIDEKTIDEASQFTASCSNAWQRNLKSIDVFYVRPDQVSKKAPSGEYVAKGSFMIYGKKHIKNAELGLAIGVFNKKLMLGPISAVKSKCKTFFELRQGNLKKSDTAKKLQKLFEKKEFYFDLDNFIQILPAGFFKIKR